MYRIINKILNKNQIKATRNEINNNTLIGTVYSTDPFKITLVPSDTPIPAVMTTGLLGLCIGSRVLLQRFGSQFIAVSVLGDNGMRYYGKAENQNITGTAMTNVTDLVFTLKANSGLYSIDTILNVRCDASATPDVKFDWEITGTQYYTVVGKNCRGGEFQASNSTTLSLTRNSGGHSLATDIYYPIPAVNGNSVISEYFVIRAGTEDTIFQFRASQITNDANNPIIISGYSHILVKKLSMISGSS